MTYIEFRDRYNGKYVDVDNYPDEWKWQCFDLVQLYNREVLNVPDYVLAGCDVVKNLIYDPTERSQMNEFFDEVDVHAMQQGDICIWGGTECGHIAIYDSYDGKNCLYFSQNPNPSQVMIINMDDHHAFRRRKETPPLPPVTENVERDEYKDQIEVKVEKLRVRTIPTLDSEILGYANIGYYNYYEVAEHDGYTWYRIAENQWVAYNEEWIMVYPGKEEEKFIKLKILDEKEDYVLVDLGKIWIKKETQL